MTIRFWAFAFLAFCLTGCGGGGSSSGAAAAPPAAPPPSIEGQYSGTWNATLSSPGVPNDTVDIALTISVTSTTISITDGEFVATGNVSPSNGFDAGSPIYSTTIDGFPCQGEFTFSGIIDPVAQVVTGSSRGQFTCTAFGRAIRIDITGPFSANKTSGKLSGTTLNQAISRFIN